MSVFPGAHVPPYIRLYLPLQQLHVIVSLKTITRKEYIYRGLFFLRNKSKYTFHFRLQLIYCSKTDSIKRMLSVVQKASSPVLTIVFTSRHTVEQDARLGSTLGSWNYHLWANINENLPRHTNTSTGMTIGGG